MPGPDGLLTVAIDFDGSMVEDHQQPLRWRPGAREFILAASASGIRLVVHSCRCTLVGYQDMPGDAEEFYRSGRVPGQVEYSWGLREEMNAFLEAEGVRQLVQIWEAPGKPIAEIYADDRSEQPDWFVLAAELGVRLPNGLQGPPPVGPAPVPPGNGGGRPGAPSHASPAPASAPGDVLGV